jgi:hypothetical protein
VSTSPQVTSAGHVTPVPLELRDFELQSFQETSPHYTTNPPNTELSNRLICRHVSSNTNGLDLLWGFGLWRFLLLNTTTPPDCQTSNLQTLVNLQTRVPEYEGSIFSPEFGTSEVFFVQKRENFTTICRSPTIGHRRSEIFLGYPSPKISIAPPQGS